MIPLTNHDSSEGEQRGRCNLPRIIPHKPVRPPIEFPSTVVFLMAQMKPFLKNMALSENQVPLFSGLANPFQKKMAGSVPHFPTHLYHIYISYIYHTSFDWIVFQARNGVPVGKGIVPVPDRRRVFYRWILDPKSSWYSTHKDRKIHGYSKQKWEAPKANRDWDFELDQ